MDPEIKSCSFGLIYLLTLVFVLQWLSLHWEILTMLLCQFPLTFSQAHNVMPHFIACLLTILVLIWTVFVIIWEMLHGRIFLDSASVADNEFCEWVQVGIDVYNLHCNYQVKPDSTPWFSAACAAAIVHRNLFFSFVPTEKIFWM